MVEVEILLYAVLIEKITKFLECVSSGKADYLVSGNKDSLEVKEIQGVKIISANDFLGIIKNL